MRSSSGKCLNNLGFRYDTSMRHCFFPTLFNILILSHRNPNLGYSLSEIKNYDLMLIINNQTPALVYSTITEISNMQKLL